jgi:hypothetical protein
LPEIRRKIRTSAGDPAEFRDENPAIDFFPRAPAGLHFALQDAG